MDIPRNTEKLCIDLAAATLLEAKLKALLAEAAIHLELHSWDYHHPGQPELISRMRTAADVSNS